MFKTLYFKLEQKKPGIGRIKGSWKSWKEPSEVRKNRAKLERTERSWKVSFEVRKFRCSLKVLAELGKCHCPRFIIKLNVWYCIHHKVMSEMFFYILFIILSQSNLIPMVIQKISFGNLPKLSRGKNQLAHRILRTQFS